jgi:plastocyanin/uncharacterized membrane protein YozB (DUF420 family)
MLSPGFLHLGGTMAADLNLVVQLAMGVALLIGMRFARQRRFRAHGRCQASVMVLNLLMIALIMAPSFHRQVSPNLDKAASDSYYMLPAIHAGLGTIAELLGIYVVLVAMGARLVPVGLRFRNYRGWMRATLLLWWIVIGLGVGTYAAWYMADSASAPAPAATSPAPAAAGKKSESTAPPDVAITFQNFSFEPKEVTIPAGTTVIWTDAGGRHTIETADGFLKSDTLVSGQTFSKRFDTPGTYEYFCDFHGTKTGTGMVGKITVVAR